MILTALVLATASCDNCPQATFVRLGNGTTASAIAHSGAASRANSVWAFYAETGLGPLNFLGTVLPGNPAFLYRAQFGAQGELIRIFDNAVLAPESLGDQLFFDAIQRPIRLPSLNISGNSYASEAGDAIGTVECSTIYAGAFSVVQTTIEFSGTTNSLLGRVDGRFRFSSSANPAFASQMPPNFKSETVEIGGYAVKETDLPLPLPLP